MPNITLFSESNTLMIKGDLVAHTVMGVLSELKLYNTMNQWVVNLSDVGKVDSSAIALLLEVIKLSRVKNIKVSFQHVPKELIAIAKLSQLDSYFTSKK